ncbi:prolipoprotein diacylglyceryl transferase [Cetobacterium sp. SF1]|uniref:prolipoprotein diacylglyceryl transferase n=1 Tax=Cetobacterium sp. SF1 TaxID=3417654 RepID=UPI003CEB719B
MDPIFLKIGSFKIGYYGLCYAISFFIGLELAKKYGVKKGLTKEQVEDYAFVAMISGLLGGRIYYVLFNYHYYFANPQDIIAVWKGGMAIHGGILGGIIGTFIYGKIKKINPFLLGDIAAAPLILGQTIGRFGNLANGEIQGVPTFTPYSIIFSLKPKFFQWFSYYNSLPAIDKIKYKELVPWGLVFPITSPAGMEFPNLPLHPAMLYESALNFLGFLFIWFYLKNKNYESGTVWWSYIIIYSVIRYFVSFFRAEDLMIWGMRAPQLMSIILIIISIIIIVYLNKNKIKK